MMPKLPEPDGYADGGKTPEGYTWSDCYWIETSVRAIQEEAYRAGMAVAQTRIEALEAALRQSHIALINSGSMQTHISKNAVSAINDLLKD